MPPLPPHSPSPRLILYHQTHHTPAGAHVPLLPLLSTPLTHLILAALHLNPHPTTPTITLNDHPPSHPRNHTLLADLATLRASGIKILALLGGAAPGTFAALDGPTSTFEPHYALLHAFITSARLDGLDLDVEEPMSLPGIVRLIDRLRADFGPAFLITLAPVAPALLSRDPRHNLSGFDYAALDAARGGDIAWYNAQFYCGWGDAGAPAGYLALVAAGWAPARVVLGVLTSARNGGGFVEMERLAETVLGIAEKTGGGWGGVMGWEYFNAEPKGEGRPWEWAEVVGGLVGARREGGGIEGGVGGGDGVVEEAKKKVDVLLVDGEGEAKGPGEFEYFTDTSDS